MKVGDLVRWKEDGDIGIVLGFVQEDVSETHEVGNPIIRWFDHPDGDGIDDSIVVDDEDLEVVSENR